MSLHEPILPLPSSPGFDEVAFEGEVKDIEQIVHADFLRGTTLLIEEVEDKLAELDVTPGRAHLFSSPLPEGGMAKLLCDDKYMLPLGGGASLPAQRLTFNIHRTDEAGQHTVEIDDYLVCDAAKCITHLVTSLVGEIVPGNVEWQINNYSGPFITRNDDRVAVYSGSVYEDVFRPEVVLTPDNLEAATKVRTALSRFTPSLRDDIPGDTVEYWDCFGI